MRSKCELGAGTISLRASCLWPCLCASAFIREKINEPYRTTVLQRARKKLWTAADKLRSSLDASVYKHVVLGLIFLKYVSDAFEERQKELREQFQNPEHDYYMAPADYADDY